MSPAIAVFVFLMMGHALWSEEGPPNLMNFQSYLTDSEGNPFGAKNPEEMALQFRIHSRADEAGEVLWAEQQTVTVDNGHFSVQLGAGDPVQNEEHDLLKDVFHIANASDRYLGVTVVGQGNEIRPRLRLMAAPYAFLAGRAEEAKSVTSNSVTGDMIQDGTVGAADLADGIGVWEKADAHLRYSNGRVGIGIGESIPTAQLEVAANVRAAQVLIGTGDHERPLAIRATGGNADWISFKKTDDTTQWHLNNLQNGLNFAETEKQNFVLFLKPGGNVGIGRVPGANRLEVEGEASKATAGDWLANSDRRIKTDVRSLTNALDIINRIQPRAFRYTDDYLRAHPSIRDIEYYNVVAQEFAEVFPESVRAGGDRLVDGEAVLQVDTHPATVHAIAAIQELHRGNLQLQSELDLLGSENAALKQRSAELESDLADLLSRVRALEARNE